MKVQLWSYNYDPEPAGIGPLSGTIARALAARGHRVEVVAAHPHYPEPRWGTKLLPHREQRDGLDVLRLPLWVGRATAAQRIRQEASFALALALAAPTLRTPDVIVVVSPSFPALVPAMLNARARRVPWVLWLQDILPAGATATGILEEGALVWLSGRLEHAAYRSAAHIVVISDSFAEDLGRKGVSEKKLTRIYNPATHQILDDPRPADAGDGVTAITMGNVGHTQNLATLTRAFESSGELARLGARFVIAGDGVAGDEVRAAITTDRVQITGVLDRDALDRELDRAVVAVVSQRYEGTDFNVPSKLMNFMARGLPVVAAVRPDSEVARIVRASDAGWVTESGNSREFAALVEAALQSPAERHRRGEAALGFARKNFTPERLGSRFEEVLLPFARHVSRRS
jgi:colanic acid biosynthesis glycosyl transferase WcaI